MCVERLHVSLLLRYFLSRTLGFINVLVEKPTDHNLRRLEVVSVKCRGMCVPFEEICWNFRRLGSFGSNLTPPPPPSPHNVRVLYFSQTRSTKYPRSGLDGQVHPSRLVFSSYGELYDENLVLKSHPIHNGSCDYHYVNLSTGTKKKTDIDKIYPPISRIYRQNKESKKEKKSLLITSSQFVSEDSRDRILSTSLFPVVMDDRNLMYTKTFDKLGLYISLPVYVGVKW